MDTGIATLLFHVKLFIFNIGYLHEVETTLAYLFYGRY